MTLWNCIHNQPTLDQFRILTKADVLYADKGGRFWGGQITEAEWEWLTDHKLHLVTAAGAPTSPPTCTVRTGTYDPINA